MKTEKYSPTGAEARRRKKENFIQPEKRRRMPLVVATVCVLAIAVAGIWFATRSEEPISTAGNHLPAASEHLRHPVSLFQDGRARHFEFADDRGNTIRYFILKSADGVIRAAFDACDVCWPAGKGYGQDGNRMVCRNCGRRFDSSRINEVQGGCNPAPLKRTIEGIHLVIRKADLLEGARYFNFAQEA